MAKIIGVFAGEPKQLKDSKNRTYKSAILKSPVQLPVAITFNGLQMDSSSYSMHHSSDRAICMFDFENYRQLSEHYQSEFTIPCFGENFLTESMPDREVCVGDQWKIGDVILEITQPREPCSNVVRVTGRSDLVKVMCNIPVTGYLARVLEPGTFDTGDQPELISRPFGEWTILRLNQTIYRDFRDRNRIQELLEVPQLADEWKQSLKKRAKSSKS